jgi:hypothetical protein
MANLLVEVVPVAHSKPGGTKFHASGQKLNCWFIGWLMFRALTNFQVLLSTVYF